ncbi:hypothetical protein D3C83_199100 [compost metagenome]
MRCRHLTTWDVKNPFEGDGVAIPDRRSDSFKKTSLLGRICGRPSITRDVPPGASDDLPGVGLFEPKGPREITV